MNSLRDAQKAKRRLDDANFYGAVLHVTYAPEMETIEETRDKMIEREKRYEKGLARVEKEKRESEADFEKDLDRKEDLEDLAKTAKPGTALRRNGKINPEYRARDKSNATDIVKQDGQKRPSKLTQNDGGDDNSEKLPPPKRMRLDVVDLKAEEKIRMKTTMKPKIVFHRR